MGSLRSKDAERLAGGVLVVGFHGTVASAELCARLRDGLCAGVVLFRRNIVDASQVRSLARSLPAAAGLRPVVAVDQEGGRVARLRSQVLQLPPMRALGGHDDPGLTREAARVLGAELASLGVSLNFAPVCDVDSNPANPVIGDRAFGATAMVVSRHALAFIEGQQASGVAACAKHFPGHGDTDADSHLELPRLTHGLERLRAVELPPFRDAIRAGVASVMTAHVLFDAVDPALPATLSPTAIGSLLRGELSGGRDDLVVVSDDLLMGAVSARWSPQDAAVMAVRAGCDMLLVCDDEAAQERCVASLADVAMSDQVFAARLRAANERVSGFRVRWPSAPAQAEGWASPVEAASREVEQRLALLGVAPCAGVDPTAR